VAVLAKGDKIGPKTTRALTTGLMVLRLETTQPTVSFLLELLPWHPTTI
jgi:hypothetical protein